MSDPRVKQLKINTGIITRLVKEKQSYEKEAEMLSKKVDKMRSEGQDEYQVKKQQEVLQESRSMIPDCLRRLHTATATLQQLLDTERELKDTAEYKSAETAVSDASKMMEQSKS